MEEVEEKRIITEDQVMGVLVYGLSLHKTKISRCGAILKIGGDNKICLLPFISMIISEMTHYEYNELAEIFSQLLKLNHQQQLSLHLRPDIKEYVDSLDFFSDMADDHKLSSDIDNYFDIKHPKDKIALLNYLAEKGGVFSRLASGTRLFRLDEDPEFLFDMPLLANISLKKGLNELYDLSNTALKRKILSSMQSMIIDAHVKYVASGLEIGLSIVELSSSISWLQTNCLNHRKWISTLSKYETLNLI